MALFLLFIIVAIALGIIGAIVKGLFWLLVIGVLVVIVDLVVLGARLGRRRSGPRHRPGR
jgi:membrane protein implicated in regulation of membrane protease activity